MKLARSPPPPFAQPEQSRVANVTIPKSRVLPAPINSTIHFRKSEIDTEAFRSKLIDYATIEPDEGASARTDHA